MRNLWKSDWLKLILVTLLVLGAVLAPWQSASVPSVGQAGNDGRLEITIGPVGVEAAGSVDYTVDGTDDHIQVQAAINALPAGGGRVVLLGFTYVWGAGQTVTRAINNVTIEGVGRATSLTGDAVTALITAGGNNWVFRNFSTDTGGVGLGAT